MKLGASNDHHIFFFSKIKFKFLSNFLHYKKHHRRRGHEMRKRPKIELKLTFMKSSDDDALSIKEDLHFRFASR